MATRPRTSVENIQKNLILHTTGKCDLSHVAVVGRGGEDENVGVDGLLDLRCDALVSFLEAGSQGDYVGLAVFTRPFDGLWILDVIRPLIHTVCTHVFYEILGRRAFYVCVKDTADRDFGRIQDLEHEVYSAGTVAGIVNLLDFCLVLLGVCILPLWLLLSLPSLPSLLSWLLSVIMSPRQSGLDPG